MNKQAYWTFPTCFVMPKLPKGHTHCLGCPSYTRNANPPAGSKINLTSLLLQEKTLVYSDKIQSLLLKKRFPQSGIEPPTPGYHVERDTYLTATRRAPLGSCSNQTLRFQLSFNAFEPRYIFSYSNRGRNRTNKLVRPSQHVL